MWRKVVLAVSIEDLDDDGHIEPRSAAAEQIATLIVASVEGTAALPTGGS
jgi:hypothetical protein